MYRNSLGPQGFRNENISRDNQQKIIMIYDISVLVSQTAHNILLFYGILNCVSQKNLQFSPILEINCAENEISLKFCQKGR